MSVRLQTRVMIGLLAAALLWAGSLIPPMQSPDEVAHTVRAHLLARGQLLLQRHNGVSGGWIDAGLAAFIDAYRPLMVKPPAAAGFGEAQAQAARQIRWQSQRVFVPEPGTGYYPPVIYLPHAVGWWVGESLGLTVSASYQLSRALALAASLAVLLLAFTLHAPSALVWALLALPMSLFQLAMPVIDGLTASLALLAVALARVVAQPASLWPAQLVPIGLFFTLVVLTSTRIHLAPMLLLLLVVAWQRASKTLWVLAVVAPTLVVGWFLFALSDTVDQRVVRPLATGEIALHYLTHPLELLSALKKTWLDPETMAFLGQSFIGILGWLDTPLLGQQYTSLGVGLFLCTIASLPHLTRPRSAGRSPADSAQKAVTLALWLAGLASLVLVFLAMLIAWSPFPALRVEGVQGRYLLIPALLLALAMHGAGPLPQDMPSKSLALTAQAIRSDHGPWPDMRRWAVVLFRCLAAPLFLAWSLNALIPTLLTRYH